MIGRRLLRITNRTPVCRESFLPKSKKLEAYRHCRWYHEVSYKQYGKDPKDVLSYHTDPRIDDTEMPVPSSGDMEENSSFHDDNDRLVRVEMMHAPWNPADVNTVQGRYPSPYPTHNSSPTTASSIASITSRQDRNGLRVASDRCIGRYFENDPVIGSEGWGRVTHTSASSSSSSSSSPLIPPGTLVTLGLPGLGTLRSSLWVPESAVLPVPDLVLERLGPAGCSLFQLGGTALRLLSDFVAIDPGEVILQNAGTSGVGFLASQLAASPLLFGSKCNIDGDNASPNVSTPVMVSLIRRRGRSKESLDKTVDYLTRVGKNAFVVAEEDFFLDEDTSETSTNHRKDRRKGTTKSFNETAIREMRARLRDLSPTGSLPKLALNTVGGDSARLLLKLLEPHAGSTMVTYGGMSGKGVQVATPQLIFHDVRAAGYWHSRWMVRQHEQERVERERQAHRETNGRIRVPPYNHRGAMVDILSRLVELEDLKCPPSHVVRLEDLQEGLLWQANQSDCESSEFPIRRKLVWDCRE